MQKPNYQLEKRRRELDKKAKKAEKLRLKLSGGRPAAVGTQAAPEAQVPPAEST
jgi:hypothetical protein